MAVIAWIARRLVGVHSRHGVHRGRVRCRGCGRGARGRRRALHRGARGRGEASGPDFHGLGAAIAAPSPSAARARGHIRRAGSRAGRPARWTIRPAPPPRGSQTAPSGGPGRGPGPRCSSRVASTWPSASAWCPVPAPRADGRSAGVVGPGRDRARRRGAAPTAGRPPRCGTQASMTHSARVSASQFVNVSVRNFSASR